MILTGENWRTRRKTCTSAALSTIQMNEWRLLNLLLVIIYSYSVRYLTPFCPPQMPHGLTWA
jgi:hypothetical protein